MRRLWLAAAATLLFPGALGAQDPIPAPAEAPAAPEPLGQAIPGTRLRAIVPEGFSVATSFPGLEHDLTETTIVVSELPGTSARASTEAWLEEDPLGERGIERESVDRFEGESGTGDLYQLREEREYTDLRRLVLLVEDSGRLLLAVATTPLAIEATTGPETLRVLQSLAWTDSSAPDPQAGQAFRVTAPAGFRVATGTRNRVEIWREDQLGPASGTDARIYITRHELPPGDVNPVAFSLGHLSESDQIRMLHVESSSESASLGGLTAVELVGRATAFDGASELVAFQRLALDGEVAYAVQGFADQEQADRFVPVFRALADGFRRAR